MNIKRNPFETRQKSTILFPSGLFSLEKDEVFPYERFAYNVLGVGIDVLHQKNLPECLRLDFTHLSEGGSPWLINCSISPQYTDNGEPLSFTIAIPELLPAIIYMFCNVVVSQLFNEENYKNFKSDPKKISHLIQHFVDGSSASVRVYKAKGIASAIRAGYEYLGLTIGDLYNISDDLDLLTKQIAYHEIAHIYIDDLKRQKKVMGAKRLAFELIADLVGAEWLYNKLIRLTPDTEEYREFSGMDTYAETIFANSLRSLQSQQAVLILMAIAGAQRSGGKVSLSGGQTHPPGLQRFQLQHVHLLTRIESNFSNVLSDSQLTALDHDYNDRMSTLVAAGLIPFEDLETNLDPLECDFIEAAADLIEELEVPELIQTVESLRSTREELSEILKKRR